MRESFDELSKALARGVSRREALKIFGAGVAGSVLALVGLSRAGAQFANSDCSDYCSDFHECSEGNCRNVCDTCPGGSANVLQTKFSGCFTFVCTATAPPATDTWNEP